MLNSNDLALDLARFYFQSCFIFLNFWVLVHSYACCENECLYSVLKLIPTTLNDINTTEH